MLSTILYYGLAGYYAIGFGAIGYVLYKERDLMIYSLLYNDNNKLSHVEMGRLPGKIENYNIDYQDSQDIIPTLERLPIR